MSSSERISVTIPPAIYAQLAEIAEREGRAVGNLAAYILETWLRQQGAPPHTTIVVQNFPAPHPSSAPADHESGCFPWWNTPPKIT